MVNINSLHQQSKVSSSTLIEDEDIEQVVGLEANVFFFQIRHALLHKVKQQQYISTPSVQHLCFIIERVRTGICRQLQLNHFHVCTVPVTALAALPVQSPNRKPVALVLKSYNYGYKLHQFQQPSFS